MTEALDILGDSCRELTVAVTGPNWISVDQEADRQILAVMQQAEGHIEYGFDKGLSVDYIDVHDRANDAVMLHGSLLRIEPKDGGVSFGVHVSATAIQGSSDPPLEAKVRPFGDLLAIADQHFGEIQAHCEAQFVYQLDDSLGSRVQLPSPLLVMVGLSPAFGVTHMEAVTLTRRTDEGISHTIQVEMGDDGKSVRHLVAFEAKQALTLQTLHDTRTITEHLSRMLLEQRRQAT